MRVTDTDAVELGIADAIISEPEGGAHNDAETTAENISDFLVKSLNSKMKKDIDVLLNERYNKFRKIGVFSEGVPDTSAEEE